MVGAPGDDLDLLCLFSLSLVCACMLGWACETRERFAKEGKLAYRKGRRLPKLVVRRAPLLRLLLLLGRAADDASDDVGCVCFARARHCRRDNSLQTPRRVGCCARAVDFCLRCLGWKKIAKRICPDSWQKYSMVSIDVAFAEHHCMRFRNGSIQGAPVLRVYLDGEYQRTGLWNPGAVLPGRL